MPSYLKTKNNVKDIHYIKYVVSSKMNKHGLCRQIIDVIK